MENKTGKYFKYAIGEIILVVIGILIALQINNWNEAKKDKAYELKMLSELYVAIEKDIAYTQSHILGYRTRETEKSINYFKQLLINEKVDMDSLNHYYGWTTYGVSFQINEGPYQALKSVGLDKISNDSLRSNIQLMYDFLVPRNRQLIKFGEDNFGEQQAQLKQLFFDDTKIVITNNEVQFIKPLIKGEFWQDPKFIELLRLSETRTSWRRNHFEDIIKDLKALKTLIQKELKND